MTKVEWILKFSTIDNDSIDFIDFIDYNEVYKRFIHILNNKTIVPFDKDKHKDKHKDESSILLNINDKAKHLVITANKIIPLTSIILQKDHSNLDYSRAEKMAFNLSLQLKELENMGLTLSYWTPADIIVVNDSSFLLGNLHNLVKLDIPNSFNIRLNYPIIYDDGSNHIDYQEKSAMIAPEILKMDGLPFITHRSASYYSLGKLCLHCIDHSLAELAGTKLFYFVERCMLEPIEQRSCLFI
tara:strand:- start:365 stop:1090 length:726 start_codon:yes stop_codon:yes gene_type:complete